MLQRLSSSLVKYKGTILSDLLSKILNKFSGEISVLDFGAKGDGLSDDTASFNAAIAAGAKIIHVPTGVYLVHNLVLPEGVTLFSKDNSSIIKFTGDSYFPLRVSTNTVVDGLTLDFSSCLQSDKAIFGESTQGTCIVRCKVIGAPTGHTIYFDGTKFSGRFYYPNKVLGNYITGGLGAGVYIKGVKEFEVSSNKLHGTGDGISIGGTTRIRSQSKITNNTVMDSGGQGIATLLISNARDTQAYEGLIVTGNTVVRAKANGIVIQSDLTVCADNVVTDCGKQTSHQGILVNANGVTCSSNVVRNNAGVGIDLGNCRKCSVIGNIVEENGWIGIEVNRCEQVTVHGNILNLNFKGKSSSQGDLQAAILCHEGNGGYQFTGENKDISIVGNTINGGDGQTYAIFTDAGSYKIVVSDNTCRNAGKVEDIVTGHNDVIVKDNITRWTPAGTPARASIEGETLRINGCTSFVAVNGAGNVQEIIAKEGKIPAGSTLRLLAIEGFTLKSGKNVSIAGDVALSKNQGYTLWYNPFVSKWVSA